MKRLILGDVHAAWGDAQAIIREARKKDGPFDEIIQVGDMGVGFPGVDPWLVSQQGETLKWIDGNHENFVLIEGRDNLEHNDPWRQFFMLWDYKPRGTIEDGILYIGGALSIDRVYRTAGVDWWPQEIPSYEDTERTLQAIEDYGAANIHTVISHDCPEGFMFETARGFRCFNRGGSPKFGRDFTREFLEEVRQQVMPERWFCGHWHFPWEAVIDGCQFRILDMSGSRHGVDYAVWES